jgi:hypothetical protein
MEASMFGDIAVAQSWALVVISPVMVIFLHTYWSCHETTRRQTLTAEHSVVL